MLSEHFFSIFLLFPIKLIKIFLKKINLNIYKYIYIENLKETKKQNLFLIFQKILFIKVYYILYLICVIIINYDKLNYKYLIN